MREKMNFETALVAYVEAVQKSTNEHFARHYDNLVPDLIQIEGGRKYVKISKTNDGGAGQKSVHSFVDVSNGDIYKPSGWNSRSKHIRGSIYGNINLTPSGSIPYLR
jgi:predicted dithiol-disulfide oxidoreductase (DUF899 family)